MAIPRDSLSSLQPRQDELSVPDECISNPAISDVQERFRAQMPIASQVAYFDHAAVAPLPACTRKAIEIWLAEATDQGDVAWQQWARRVDQVRETAARLLNAAPSEIALVPNTTYGINLVAEGFPWQSGDNLVTLANEFPSNQYPWMNQADRGVEVRRVPVDGGGVDLDRLAAACDARTRIVSVSWVGYASGWRIDPQMVAQIAHRQGALFFLDAIQGLGVFPLDVRAAGVDFLAADGHKWLLGPEGAGIFYCREDHLSLLRPLMVGWNSVRQGSVYTKIELNLRDDAARYEGGSQNMIGFTGLGASLDLLTSLGVGPLASPVAAAILAITDYAADRLQEIGARLLAPRTSDHRSGIITFQIPGLDSNDLRRRLETAGIITRCRAGGVRISPHGYATRGEIDHLIAEITSVRTRPT